MQQRHFTLKTRSVELTVAEVGGMLGPVSFFPDNSSSIRPYAAAPWADAAQPDNVPPVIANMRGDWFCSAFGENVEPSRGHQLPPHGETANRRWRYVEGEQTDSGCWLRLEVELPLQGGRCEATTAIVNDESVIYQIHRLDRLTGPINPGHHATLLFPPHEGSGWLSFSKFMHAQTYVVPTELPQRGGYSRLKPDSVITDLRSVPCVDGSNTDLSRYPARRGFEDVAIVCADPSAGLGWSAVTFPEERFVWFAIRNSRQLASTLLWFSNGGRHYPPWNGRHINVLGIEDATSYFHVGHAASCRRNALADRGVRTCLEPDAEGQLAVPYIQGVARVPAGFDRVATIQSQPGSGCIVITSEAGPIVVTRCDVDFLRNGSLPKLRLH